MIPGLSIETLLTVHVAVSLIGIATGLVAMPALAAGRWLGGWQAAFLITTALTSVTGFLFPFSGVTTDPRRDALARDPHRRRDVRLFPSLLMTLDDQAAAMNS